MGVETKKIHIKINVPHLKIRVDTLKKKSCESQTSFFNKTFIKNGSHGTIHTFKNYFATVFLVFSKISGIQTHPKSEKMVTAGANKILKN